MSDAQSGTPLPTRQTLLLAIVEAARHERRQYVVRWGERPDDVVLVGHKTWAQICSEASREPHLFRLADDRNELLCLDGTRFILADIPRNEWRIAVLTAVEGSIPQN